MYKLGIRSYGAGSIGILLAIAALVIFLAPSGLGESTNDACFNGGCHSSPSPRPIDRSLYDSNPHSILKCIDCHVNSTDPINDSNHGLFIRQLNGSNITGPLTTKYYSQNFSLCYYCHEESKVVGILPGYVPSPNHVNPPIIVSSIGTNFINNLSAGYYDGNKNYPTNIHWDHLDDFGSVNWGNGGKFDLNPSANLTNNRTSYQSCPVCHNVHGTNYPKMTKNDLAINYSSDANGTFGYIGSNEYNNPGGDLYCNGCHNTGTTFKYYRNETNLFEDCISCHVDGAPGNVNRTAFSQGIHVNINTSDGIGLVNNSDCWTCHYKKDMDLSNIRQCADCHTGSGTPEAPQAPKVRTHLPAVTNYSCVDCHSKVVINPGVGAANVTAHYSLRPTVPTTNYCDYCHGPNATSPFPALNKTIPSFSHDDPSWDGNSTCRTCHTNSNVSADPLANDTSSFHELTTEYGDVFNGTVKADCVLCHIQKAPQFVSAPDPPHDTTGMNATDCYGCHGANVAGTQAQKLHNPTPTTTGGCIACHSNNATRYYVNTSLFERHANVNTSDGIGNVTDADCKTCHHGAADGTMGMKLGAANASNTYFCQDCHTTAGTGPIKPTDPTLIKDGFRHGQADCRWCHIAGDSQPRPLPLQYRYHPNGPRGTAAGNNCLSCHYNANLPDLPFHAPGEGHSTYIGPDEGGCSSCHSAADNHLVYPLNANTPPSVSGLSVTTPVTSGTPAQVQATIADDMLQIAAAQYQVTNASGVVIDWTNMTPGGGRFSSQSQNVYANIDTSSLKGNYTVNVKGMASAPRTNPSLPYYPFNGQWSGISNTQLTVVQPTGYANGTISGSLGNIVGAIITTNTGISTVTNATGFYSLNLPNGMYQLTASKEPEYYPNSSVTVTVTAYTTVSQDIVLTLKPVYTLSGKVTNASSGLAINRATVQLVAYPQYNTTTNSTGDYSVNVPAGTYNVKANASGYASNISSVSISTNTIKNFALDVNAKMVGILWISSYDTSGTITSTMASQLPRSYDIGTQFFGQYDSRKDTAGWYTAILVSDVYGTGANLTINYLYDNGTLYSTSNGVVPVNGTFTLAPGNSGLLEGEVTIKSDNPIVAEKRIASYAPGTWSTTGIMSTLMPEKSSATTAFFGQYDSRKDTAGWYTAILVSDVYGTGANLTINYLYDNGTLYSTNSKVVPVNGTLTLTPGDSGLLEGKVTIKSNNPVVAEKRIAYFTPGTWNAYDLMADSMLKTSDATRELIVPVYDGRKDTAGWYSVILVSDIYGTGANVKVDYLYPNGTLYTANNLVVPVNGTLTIVPSDIGLLVGKVLIHSDNLVAGEERIVNFAPGTWNTRAAMSYNLLKNTDASQSLIVPQYDSRGQWNASVVVSAVNGAASPAFYYYNGTGIFDHTEYHDIPVNGSYVLYPGDITQGRLAVGRVMIRG